MIWKVCVPEYVYINLHIYLIFFIKSRMEIYSIESMLYYTRKYKKKIEISSIE